MKYLIICLLLLVQLPLQASEVDYKLEFGLVLHDENGEPIGFKETKNIPIQNKGKNSLYGLVISNDDKENFVIGSVHTLPNNLVGVKKILGKSMVVNQKGAVFMKTQKNDLPGTYIMEIYINNILHETIEYQLQSES